jgi:hypothetical protein
MQLRGFFAEKGVDLAPPKAMFFKDRLGMLMVRTTLEDHDKIQRTLAQFVQPERQVLLELKVAEFRGDAVGVQSAFGFELNDKKILTDPQYRLLIRALERKDQVDVSGPQRVVTLSGQSARFQLPTVETLGLNDAILHVVPHVLSDDRTIPLAVRCGRQDVANAVLGDKQTVMLQLPAVKKIYAEGGSARIFVRIAFVTVTIIDAAGNRLHAERDDPPLNPFQGIWPH